MEYPRKRGGVKNVLYRCPCHSSALLGRMFVCDLTCRQSIKHSFGINWEFKCRCASKGGMREGGGPGNFQCSQSFRIPREAKNPYEKSNLLFLVAFHCILRVRTTIHSKHGNTNIGLSPKKGPQRKKSCETFAGRFLRTFLKLILRIAPPFSCLPSLSSKLVMNSSLSL